jgi:triphosphoribosyl-dephospho-CoA synthase
MMAALARSAQRAYPSEAQRPCIPDAGAIAASAVHCLLLELETWPKPGLVSHIDPGSHDDMDADTFRVSVSAIEPYFHALAEAGACGCGMGRLRNIGLDAEAAMLAATSGVNTHRGAIFGMGLLCAAAGARAGGRIDPTLSLGATVSRLWGGSILDGPVLLHSHGSRARRRFSAGGARMEAAQGVRKPIEVEWRQMPYGWAYSVDGGKSWRRHLWAEWNLARSVKGGLQIKVSAAWGSN